MQAYFDWTHTVTDEEIDGQGHVHNLRYLAWTLRAAGKDTERLGWGHGRMLAEHGCDWVVRSHEVTYKAAAVASEAVIVRTWVSDISRYAATRSYAICRPSDKTLLARVTTRWAMLDFSSRRAVAIPASVLASMEVLETAPPLPWKH